MENRVSHYIWSLQIPSNAIWSIQYPGWLPKIHQQNPSREVGYLCDGVPGQHSYLHKRSWPATYGYSLLGPGTAPEVWLFRQLKKVSFPSRRDLLLGICGINVGHQHGGGKNSGSLDLDGAKVYQGYSGVFRIC